MEDIGLVVFLKVIENLPYNEVGNICSVSKRFAYLCSKYHDAIWNLKIKHDFSFEYNWRSVGIDPEEAYSGVKKVADTIDGTGNYYANLGFSIRGRELNFIETLVYNNNLPGIIYLMPTTQEIKKIYPRSLSGPLEKGNFNMIKYLVDNGFNIHFNNDEIIKYVFDKDTLNYLVENYNINPYAHNDRIMTNIAAKGDIEFFNYLVEQGHNPNANDDDPLTWALENEYIDMAKILIEKYGANPNAQGLGEASGITYSVLSLGDFDFFMYMINKGFHLNLYNIRHSVPTHNFDEAMVTYFLDNGIFEPRQFMNSIESNFADQDTKTRQKRAVMRYVVNNLYRNPKFFDYFKYSGDPIEFMELIKNCVDCDKDNSIKAILKLDEVMNQKK